MPIPLPNLDDRRWTDLAADGQAQVPRYAPVWTDFNVHDPGITLIDLFAWLAEMTNYRINRVPSAYKRKFLNLLGFQTADPQAASVTLSFTPVPATSPFLLPAGSEFEGVSPDQNVVPFRTLSPVTISVVTLSAVQVEAASGGLVDHTQDFKDGFAIKLLDINPQPPAAFYLGFDAITPLVPVALGFRFAGPGQDSAERKRIMEEAAAQADACRPVEPRFDCGAPPAAPLAPLLPPHHSVRIVWEAFTSAGWTAIDAAGVADDTRSFTLDGIVQLTLPANITKTAIGGVAASLFYVRARMTAGAFDAVPEILDIAVNAVPAEQAVPAGQTFLIKAGLLPTGSAPGAGDQVRLTMDLDAQKVIQGLAFGSGTGPNVRVWSYTAPTAASTGAMVIDLELAGAGTGLPDQQVSLAHAQVQESSPEVYTLAGTGWQQWSRRNDFLASSRTDYNFVLDPTTATVTFGSGERGQAPPAGSLILTRYRTTLAGSGNLAARSITRLRKSPVNDALLSSLAQAIRDQLKTIATNRSAAVNGAGAESLDNGLGRAVEVLHAHERLLDLAEQVGVTTLDQIDRNKVRALVAPFRAVNLLDTERIALSVPGTRVERARAWAALHPSYPCLEALGVVTVVIVPDAPVSPDVPVPSPGLLDAVWRYLNRRRMICTNLQVTGPQYIEVTVTASVRTRTGHSAANVKDRIANSLAVFLEPLAGGPDSLGWPFGRSVYRSEILQLIQNVLGVDHVESLSMQAGDSAQQCGDIALCPLALVRSGAHQLEVL